MDVFAKFSIRYSGDRNDAQVIESALEKRYITDYVCETKQFTVEETSEIVYANDFAELAEELAKAVPGIVFVIEGTTDSNGNEFQNFLYQKTKDRLTEQLSDWYHEEDGKCVSYGAERVLIGAVTAAPSEPKSPCSKTQEQIKKEWQYTVLPDGTLCLDDYLGKDSFISVPKEIGGSIVTELGEGALSTCVDMFGQAIRKLPRGQKKARDSIKGVTLPDTLKTIKKAAFQDSPIENIAIPDSVETIEEMAFQNCKALSEISFGTGLKEIGRKAFSGIHKIPKWYLPDGVETIQTEAFMYSSIDEIHIPASVKEIGKYAIAPLWEAKAVIFGKPNSAAETYAKENGIPFIADTEE